MNVGIHFLKLIRQIFYCKYQLRLVHQILPTKISSYMVYKKPY